ncbi:hypothetical protein PENSPDRAFT_188415 [Peniophora sp. CONT]|nr:hypothetical protein PENSPDRAFT_188415 [Peniophora sp. CONT]
MIRTRLKCPRRHPRRHPCLLYTWAWDTQVPLIRRLRLRGLRRSMRGKYIRMSMRYLKSTLRRRARLRALLRLFHPDVWVITIMIRREDLHLLRLPRHTRIRRQVHRRQFHAFRPIVLRQ